MKIINIKSLLILAGFLWVCLSFMGFTQMVSQRSAENLAEIQIQHAQRELLEKSKNLKFKLAQWSYNYHLVKTKGLDFDQEGFLTSEFNDMYFFKFEENTLKTQWIKSKDMSSVTVPTPGRLLARMKSISQDEILKKDFIYFADKTSEQGPKIFFGFPILDDVLGEGVLLSTLDLDYVQLLSPDLNTTLLDSKSRFLFHPQKEYIGQSAKHLLSNNTNDLFEKKAKLPVLNLEFIYKVPKAKFAVEIFWPLVVTCLGLVLAFGVLIYETFMQAPINLKSAIDITSDSFKASESTKDEYGSILKLNEIRDSLNQMSLLSSVLKGRIDLAANGELSPRLFENLKNDFDVLDRTIESTYLASQDGQVTNPSKSNPKFKELNANPNINQIVNADNKTEIPVAPTSISQAAAVFRDQGFDVESEFENSATFDNLLDFSELEIGEDFELLEHESELQSDEIKSNPNFANKGQSKGVVFQEYIGADSETNDWAKIIEELTEEINTAKLKPTEISPKDNSIYG